MIGAVTRVQGQVESARDRAMRLLRAARRRSRWFDHMARAYQRYQNRRGDRMAAAMTYFGFLSFFPLLALAYALLGYLVGVSERARTYLVDAINSILPGLADKVPIEQIAQAKATAGLIGLVGLLITGLGWVDAVRQSVREIWGNDPGGGGNFVVKKLWDVGMLAFLGTMLILSVVVSGVATKGTHRVLDVLGLEHITGMGTALWVLSLCVAIFFDAVIFLVVFSRLSGTRAPWRRLIRGALFGAVGFESLKLVATLLVGSTTRNPVYASFAVVVGLVVWIDIVSRFVLFSAAWTATRRVILNADGADDVKVLAEAKGQAGNTDGADRPAASREPPDQDDRLHRTPGAGSSVPQG